MISEWVLTRNIGIAKIYSNILKRNQHSSQGDFEKLTQAQKCELAYFFGDEWKKLFYEKKTYQTNWIFGL